MYFIDNFMSLKSQDRITIFQISTLLSYFLDITFLCIMYFDQIEKILCQLNLFNFRTLSRRVRLIVKSFC